MLFQRFVFCFIPLFAAVPALSQGNSPRKPITWSTYVETWPGLNECIDDLKKDDTASAMACLGDLIHQDESPAGALNLRAQIHRQENAFDKAMDDAEQAIELEPDQALHYYQQGLIAVQRIKKTKNPMKKWKLSNIAYDAHEKAMKLDPKQFLYRRYVVMHKLQAPAMAGGDKDGALELCEEGLTLGVSKCLALRAYCNLNMNKNEQAFVDLDASMNKGIFSYVAFKAGGDRAAALKRHDLALKYYQNITKNIPDKPFAFYILGDYLWKQKDSPGAKKAFEKVVALQEDYLDAAQKLASLKGKEP